MSDQTNSSDISQEYQKLAQKISRYTTMSTHDLAKIIQGMHQANSAPPEISLATATSACMGISEAVLTETRKSIEAIKSINASLPKTG